MYSQNVDAERTKAQPWALVKCEGMKRREREGIENEGEYTGIGSQVGRRYKSHPSSGAGTCLKFTDTRLPRARRVTH
jgi:hypothetical protein